MMKEFEIQNALFNENYNKFEVQIPNYTPPGWWECDLCGISKARYLTEYEIKLSRSDYFADFKKSDGGRHEWVDGKLQLKPGILKHERLRTSDCVPKFYWFVVSEELSDLDFPDYAGLIIAKEVKPEYKHGKKWVNLNKIKDAPRLSKEKVSDQTINRIMTSFNYRYWDLRRKVKT